MKKYLPYILIGLACMLLSYAFGAFSAASFNISHWHTFGRIIIFIVFLVGWVVLSAFYEDSNKKQK